MSSILSPWRFKQPRHGEYRADAHLVRLAAGHREAAEHAERLEPALSAASALHHHAGGGAVGKLAGIAGGDRMCPRRAPASARPVLRASCRRGCLRPLAASPVLMAISALVSLSTTFLRRRSGTISSSKRPACCAAAVRRWLSSAIVVLRFAADLVALAPPSRRCRSSACRSSGLCSSSQSSATGSG